MSKHLNVLLNALCSDSFTTSLESLPPVGDGGTKIEREYEIYGIVDDMEAMISKSTGSERQEQWGMPCDFGKEYGVFGSIRVRMTQTDGDPVYEQTIKSKVKDGSKENEMSISKDTYDIFSSLVPNGLLKTRYFVPLEGMDYTLEVDVFTGADGKICSEVKIDLEVPEGVNVNEIKIPFVIKITRVIKPGKKSQEDGDYVGNLFRKHYEVPNPSFKRN